MHLTVNAIRRLIDFYRRQRPALSINHEESGLENMLFVHFDDQYELEVEPTRQSVLAALKQLSERDRTLIYYRYYLNVTNREIARQMNMNENTVSAMMSRARKRPKVLLANEL